MKKNILMLSALFLSITAMAQTDVTTGVMRGKDLRRENPAILAGRIT